MGIELEGAANAPKKKMIFKMAKTETHWVGDGFFVSTLIYPDPKISSHFDPFVLLDYAAPKEFSPSQKQRGVGEHPHRGFETVTFAIQGEISHRDSGGGGGTIGAGECQWMTAGRGVVHEEFFSKQFSDKGGVLEMVQVWVNLPASFKMTAPKYQGVTKDQIPVAQLAKGVNAKVFAGTLNKVVGPCSTHTPMNAFDVSFDGSAIQDVVVPLPVGSNTLVLVLRGELSVSDQHIKAGEVAVLSQEGAAVEMLSKAGGGARALVLNGMPINEPMVASGPFVMNTQAEIAQAISDYRAGKMGRLPPQ
jgi:redox-sensitive bicupin YhaK (pirin superfamily)